MEDEQYCVDSANQIRHFLTDQLSQAKPGKSLATSIAAIRAAVRAFVEDAGGEARNFRYHRNDAMADEFSVALGELRSRVGLHVALIADHYGIEVEDEQRRFFHLR